MVSNGLLYRHSCRENWLIATATLFDVTLLGIARKPLIKGSLLSSEGEVATEHAEHILKICLHSSPMRQILPP